MANRFVRSIRDIHGVKNQPLHTNEQNDLLSDTKGHVYVRTKNKYVRITDFSHLETEMVELQEQVDALEPENEKMVETVNNLKKKQKSLSDELEKFKDSYMDDVDKAIENIKYEDLKARSDIQDIKEQINDFDPQDEKARKKIKEIENQIDNLKSDIDSLDEDNIVYKKDTEDWQKYKLTQDNGKLETVKLNREMDNLRELKSGFYYTTQTPGVNELGVVSSGYTNVFERNNDYKTIIYQPYNTNDRLIMFKDEEWKDWEFINRSNASSEWQDINIKNDYKKSDIPDFDPSYCVIEHNDCKEVFIRFGFENLKEEKNIVGEIPSELVPHKIYDVGVSTIAKIPPKIVITSNGNIEIHPNENDEYKDSDYVIYQGNWLIKED